MKLDAMLYMGNGGWGNAVHFLNDNSTDRIYGWKPNRFYHALVIDLCHHIDDADTPIYETTSIKWEDDPRDMFFADVRCIGSIPTKTARIGGQVTQDAVMDVYRTYCETHQGPLATFWKKFKKIFTKGIAQSK